MSVNISELAARLNLSIGTVSRILNDESAPFAPETRRRVQALAAELKYQPNSLARALATGRTDTVAFWIRNLLNPYDAWVARSFEAYVEAQSYDLVLRLFGDEAMQKTSPRRLGFPDKVDGIVTHGLPPQSWFLSTGKASRPVPIVITGGASSPELLDQVGIDRSRASRAAVEHLVGTGRRRVAFCTAVYDVRYEAYMSVMAEAGLTPEIIPTVENPRSEIRRRFREYVESAGCPEALFCFNDNTAISVYRALCDLGLRVPEDVALVGCDGIEETEYLPVPITTIVTPVAEMCRLSWQYLKNRMQEPDGPPQQILLEAHLVVRESSEVDRRSV